MFRPRLIPVLLLKGTTLVKSRRFGEFRYIGDPINAVRLFNEMKADELFFFDIAATREGRPPPPELLTAIGEEANMPFGVGGGIRTLEHIRKVIAAGAEKAVLGTIAAENPGFVKAASDEFGTSTITVCMDVLAAPRGEYRVCVRNGSVPTRFPPDDFARLMEDSGAGEIVVQSVDRDGMLNGYDLALIAAVSRAVSIPVVALGGAATLEHARAARQEGHASALAAGSMFVFQGPGRGVLISYPERAEIPF